MELGTIEREVFVDATPDVVFDVVSNPEHVRRWWPDEAHYDVRAGATGTIVFGKPGTGETTVGFTVVEVAPPHRFVFRWTQPPGEPAVEGNSLLVTFELTAARGGTLLRMTETGFREMGWEAALLEQQYNDHVSGWNFYLPRLEAYAAQVGTLR